jgi:hypothetical protein
MMRRAMITPSDAARCDRHRKGNRSNARRHRLTRILRRAFAFSATTPPWPLCAVRFFWRYVRRRRKLQPSRVA